MMKQGKELRAKQKEMARAAKVKNKMAQTKLKDAEFLVKKSTEKVRNLADELKDMPKSGYRFKAKKAEWEAATKELAFNKSMLKSNKAAAKEASKNVPKGGSLERTKKGLARDKAARDAAAAKTAAQPITQAAKEAGKNAEKLGLGARAKRLLGLGLTASGIAALIPGAAEWFSDEGQAISDYRDAVDALAGAETADEGAAAAEELARTAPGAARAERRAKRRLRKYAREGGMRISGAKKLQAAGFGAGLDPRRDFTEIYDDFYSTLDSQGKAGILRYGRRDGKDYLFGGKHRQALAAIGGKKPSGAAKKGSSLNLPEPTVPRLRGSSIGTTDSTPAPRAKPDVPERVVRAASIGGWISPGVLDQLKQRGISEEDILAAAAEYHAKYRLEGNPPTKINTQR